MGKTFVVFDLDGTLADIGHRAHYVRGPSKDFTAFFAACVDDLPNAPVIEALAAHLNAGHKVEIWSGRSDEVKPQTETWLLQNGIDHSLLTHMRPAGDYIPDVALKRSWLRALHPDERPDAVYDDRGRVVDMWREEGIACFQVAPDWEKPKTISPIADQLLTIMVGPSGAGKSTWISANVDAAQVLSTDDLRQQYCGNLGDQSRNDDVFAALRKLAIARLECGLPVTIDATNLRRKDRLGLVSLAPPSTIVRYVVCNRPMAAKLADAAWRRDARVGERPLLDVHEERFNAQLKDILAGDGLPNVVVLDTRSDQRAAA